MNNYEIISSKCKRSRQRKGRGMSSGCGKYCTRGQKGQNYRSGSKFRIGFEGGQTPLYLRIPKFGFYSGKSKSHFAINLADIDRLFQKGETVSLASLASKKIIGSSKIKRIKILGDGTLTKQVIFAQDISFSKSALLKIKQLT